MQGIALIIAPPIPDRAKRRPTPDGPSAVTHIPPGVMGDGASPQMISLCFPSFPMEIWTCEIARRCWAFRMSLRVLCQFPVPLPRSPLRRGHASLTLCSVRRALSQKGHPRTVRRQ